MPLPKVKWIEDDENIGTSGVFIRKSHSFFRREKQYACYSDDYLDFS